MRVFFYAMVLGIIGFAIIGPIGGMIGAIVGAIMGLASQMKRQGQKSSFAKMGDKVDAWASKKAKEREEREKPKRIEPDSRYN